MIMNMPAIGTRVRRDKDGKIYTVGRTTNFARGEYVMLYPVWSGRAHDKTVTHFLNQYTLVEE